MSHFDTLLTDADPGFFDLMGKEAVYNGDEQCRVIENSDMVILQGEESVSSHNEITLSFLLSEVTPKRGKLVTLGSKTYTLGRQIENDGSVAKHLVER